MTDIQTPRLETICEVVAAYYQLSVLDIRSSRRRAGMVLPRHIAFFLAAGMTTKSFTQIGRFFTGRAHSSIGFGVDKIDRMAKSDPIMATDLRILAGKIESKARDCHALGYGLARRAA